MQDHSAISSLCFGLCQLDLHRRLWVYNRLLCKAVGQARSWARHPHSQVQCVNKPLKLLGVDRSRVVTEKGRGTAFQGYLDLAGEHAECLSHVATDEEPVGILALEVDNAFSFFTEKAVTLQVSKRAKASPATKRESTGRSFSMGRLTDASGRLADAEGSPSTSDSASFLIGSRSGSLDHRVTRLRGLLREAVRLCPDEGAREHLLAAQAQIEEYAQHMESDETGSELSQKGWAKAMPKEEPPTGEARARCGMTSEAFNSSLPREPPDT
eukprot:Skav202849  [mRNA]  locus=scaffold2311:84312:87391:+ [translate_table: standard]